jgi:hypothetical protein
MGSHTINYSSDAPEKGLIIHSTINRLCMSWKDMHQALIDAASKTDLFCRNQNLVLQTSLDDFLCIL